MILNNEIYDTELKEEGYFEVNVLVKWAHLCYMIAFFMMFVSALQFYALNSLLGDLSGVKQIIKFCNERSADDRHRRNDQRFHRLPWNSTYLRRPVWNYHDVLVVSQRDQR